LNSSRRGSQLPIHNAIRKYGLPQLQVLCLGEKTYISELEIKAVESYQTCDRRFGYNLSLGGTLGPNLAGRLLSEEHKNKISQSLRGRQCSLETREKLSQSLRGRIFSEEHRKNIGCASRGRYPSLETRLKMSKAQRGILKTPEHRRNIKLSHVGMKGKTLSQESRDKVSEANKGRTHSGETKEKMRESALKVWAARRGSR
jgi:hypothetical protein